MNRELGPYDWQYYLTWEGRIGPRACMVGSQVIGAAGCFAALPLFGISMIWTDSSAIGFPSPFLLLLVAALSISGSSLLVRRAHDLGWPATVSLATAFVPFAIVLAAGARTAFYSPETAQTEWLQYATSTPVVIAAFFLAGVQYFWLALKKGHPAANRYGPVPSESEL